MKQLEHLAEFVSQFKLECASDNVVEAASIGTVDTICAALGGRTNPMFQSICNTYLSYEKDGRENKKNVALWGTENSMSLKNAVFLNAMSGHILELDDVHVKSKTHTGTVVIPAAWCLAEYLGKTGKEYLEAVICGYEVMIRIGMGFGVSAHRNKGWHVTGTAGVFGATAACGKLLGFSMKQMVDAFGLAGTQACTTWAFLSDGATNKVLHPARAAENGLESCLLVLGGMRGSANILDAADGGIYPMMSDAYDYDLVDHDLGVVYEILNMDKKPYPCCRSTHCAIDAAIELKHTYHIQAEQIDRVQVDTYLVGLKQCGTSENSKIPHQAAHAKFSTPYVSACAFLKGTVGLDDFETDIINSSERQNLLKRITVCENSLFTSGYPDSWGCRMKVWMKNGACYKTDIQNASGSVSSPLTQDQLVAKAVSCCREYHQEWVQNLCTKLLHMKQWNTLPSLSYQIGNQMPQG